MKPDISVGKHFVSKTGATLSGCGGKGVLGTIASYSASRIYVSFDNCGCVKKYGGGCDGYPRDRYDIYIEWTPSVKAEQLCKCNLDMIMVLGCTCGGK